MDWRFSLFLLSMFAMLFGFSWGTSPDGLCHGKFVTDVLGLGNKDGAYNCFDFWFNRYQSIVGALATIGAAAYAGWWVKRQILATRAQIDQINVQNELSLQQTAAVRADRLIILLDEAEALRDAMRDAFIAHENAWRTKHQFLGAIGFHQAGGLDEFEARLQKLNSHRRHLVEGIMEEFARRHAVCKDCYLKLVDCASTLRRTRLGFKVHGAALAMQFELEGIDAAFNSACKCKFIWDESEYYDEMRFVEIRKIWLQNRDLPQIIGFEHAMGDVVRALRGKIVEATDVMIGN